MREKLDFIIGGREKMQEKMEERQKINLVIGYSINLNHPVVALLHDSKQFKLVTSGSLFYKKHHDGNFAFFNNTTGQWLPNFKNLFEYEIVPKRYIDSVVITKKKNRMPLYVDQTNVIDPVSCVKHAPRLLLTQKDLDPFFEGFSDPKIAISNNFRGQPKENLYNCQERVSESQFVHRFFHVKHYGTLKSRLVNAFFDKVKYDRAMSIYIPKRVEYAFMYFEKDVNFEDPTEFPTTSIHKLILRKMFKHVVERLCPFVSVSLSKELCYKAVALALCLAAPANLRLEFSPFLEESCYACTVEEDDTGNKLYAYASSKFNKEMCGLNSDTLNRIAIGCNSDKIKLKTRHLVPIDRDNKSINRSMVIFRNKRRHYCCFDSTSGKILNAFLTLDGLISELKKITKLPHLKTRFGFYHCDRALRAARKVVSQSIIHRIITEPSGFLYAEKSSRFYLGRSVNIEKNASWFDKGRCACLLEERSRPVSTTCFDFSNFYATVLVVNKGIDDHLARSVSLMMRLRETVSSIKSNIVSLLGLSRHYDYRVYNLIKEASVAACIATIDRNEDKELFGVTTDGIIFKGSHVGQMRRDRRYPIKRESVLVKYIYYDTNNSYFGWDRIKKHFVVKGVVGKNNPLALKKYITALIYSTCKKLAGKKKVSVVKRLRRVLQNSPNRDFVFVERSEAKRLYYPAEYVYQELCQDRYLAYAKMFVEPNSNVFVNGVHKKKPEFVGKLFHDGLCHVNCIFALDVDKYIETFFAKTKVAFRMLVKAYPKHRRYLTTLFKSTLNMVGSFFKREFEISQRGCVIPGALINR